MNSPKTSNNLTKIPDSIDSKLSLPSSSPSPLIHIDNPPITHNTLSADDNLERHILNLYGDANDQDYAALGVSSVSKYNPVYLDLDDFANPSPLSESSAKKSSAKKSSAKKSSAKKSSAKKSSAKKSSAKKSYSKKRKSKKSKAGSKKRKSKKTKKRRY
jgi:hypothetical protein